MPRKQTKPEPQREAPVDMSTILRDFAIDRKIAELRRMQGHIEARIAELAQIKTKPYQLGEETID